MKIVRVNIKDTLHHQEAKQISKLIDNLQKLIDDNAVWLSIEELEELNNKVLKISNRLKSQAAYYKNH